MTTDKAITGDDKYRQALKVGGTTQEVAATKQFVVNATGNLFVATTLNGGESGDAQISEEAKKAFSQVSVFFAAMTKAMVEVDDKSRLYDYETINKIVSKSAMFVKVTDSTVDFKSKSWGVKFGADLIETLFGLTGGLGAIAKSLSDMIVGIGKEANAIEISGQNTDNSKRVGTIIFVCEYLLGAVSITPIVLNINARQAAAAYEAGPCFSANKEADEIQIIKQIYMFVPPEFIKEAEALNSAMQDKELGVLVNELIGYIRDQDPSPVEATEEDSTSEET